MEPSRNFRQKYLNQGARYGYIQALEEALGHLDTVIDSPDPELTLQSFRVHLSEQIAVASRETSKTSTTATQGAKPAQPAGDLGDQVAALMADKRGKALSPQPAPAKRDFDIIDWGQR